MDGLLRKKRIGRILDGRSIRDSFPPAYLDQKKQEFTNLK